MDHSEIVEQIRNPRIWIQQIQFQFLSISRDLLAVRISQSQSGEHAKECAVHRHAFAEIEDEMIHPGITQLADQCLEIDARAEIRPSRHLHKRSLFHHRHRHHWSFIRHSFLSPPVPCSRRQPPPRRSPGQSLSMYLEESALHRCSSSPDAGSQSIITPWLGLVPHLNNASYVQASYTT